MSTYILPLYRALPSAARAILTEHQQLGMNTVLVCVSEEDMLYYRQNITTVIRLARELGLNVWVSPWGYGGLFGGEALSASLLHHRLTGQRSFLNSVYTLGPDADVTASGEAVTTTPFFQLERMQQLAAEAGASTFHYDEMKLQRPGQDDPSRLPVEYFARLAANARRLGLRNALTLSYTSPADLELARELMATGLLDELGFTRYYSPGRYHAPPAEYICELMCQLQAAIAECGHPVRALGWIQGFDWEPGYEPFMSAYAEAHRNHGVDTIGIWGDSCVNDTPMLVPALPGHHYDQIAGIFAA
jgi:hypothetical protein